MEPSCPAKNLFCYFSENESQFLVTPSGDGGVNSSYSLSSGIHKYIYNAPIVENSIKENIRWKSIQSPSTGNITIADSIPETGIHKNSTSAIINLNIDGTGRERSLF